MKNNIKKLIKNNIHWSLIRLYNLIRFYLFKNRYVKTDKNDCEFPYPNLFIPGCQLVTARQIRSKIYKNICKEMLSPPKYSRKQWEFVYILRVLQCNEMMKNGKKGLGFGCGQDPISAVMAKHGCKVLATDLDFDRAKNMGWVNTLQHASSLESLNKFFICNPKTFKKNVSFENVDMNDIPEKFNEKYDFVFSSCALEHLGSIRNGIDFIKNSLKCLKIGGIAVHTTEFNLDSLRYGEENKTLENEHVCLFRKIDFDNLTNELEKNNEFEINYFNYHSGYSIMDDHIDFPPYSDSHLKLRIENYTSTSIGLSIRRK